MNKERRKTAERIQTDLQTQLTELEQLDITNIKMRIEELKGELENLKDEEDDAYNNLPESFQNGEKGEAMQEAINNLDTIIGEVDEVYSGLDHIDELTSVLTDAIEHINDVLQ